MINPKPISVKEFGQILTREIKDSPYTSKEVLSKCGLDPSYLYKWREGIIKEPTFKQVIEIANILGRPFEIFIFGMEQEPHVKLPLSVYQANLEMIIEIAQDQLSKSEKQKV